MIGSKAVGLTVHHHVMTLSNLPCSIVEICIYCEVIIVVSCLEAWWGDGLRIDVEWRWLINFDGIISPALEHTSVCIKSGSFHIDVVVTNIRIEIGWWRAVSVEICVDMADVFSSSP